MKKVAYLVTRNGTRELIEGCLFEEFIQTQEKKEIQRSTRFWQSHRSIMQETSPKNILAREKARQSL